MGNLDSKLSPYYAIADESGNGSHHHHSGHSKSKHDKSGSNGLNGRDSLSDSAKNFFWTIKRVNNFNHELKSATLFEFNHNKFSSSSGASSTGHSPLDSKKNVAKHLTYALNQIKVN